MNIPTLKFKNEAKVESKPDTAKLPQIVDVPVVEELPEINVPSFRICKVEEPAPLFTASPFVPDVIPLPFTVVLPKVVVASAVVPVAVKFVTAKLLVVALVPVAFVKLREAILAETKLATCANKFVIFAHTIDEEAVVEVAIVVVAFKIAPEPVIVTTFVEDANIFTISPTLVVLAKTEAFPLSFIILEESTM